ncbi:type I glyceraldehyde-3-phosphate dehydrogenase [Sulfoacidibacillus thermotolerans]|uniref:Glyceraldehyde-3-phosphate dehydrogenase n=1 Tax=Sulfoacidibacillus thermotolerans TaxID=1765684 RepID=A0A2U3D988_SULT2|nr:type I glyceraldehyde-3-phosphate dehydrogenase [Sulfoacidibacillus thermotolerans]PWI57847.1 type I glyceraldehyde-3-phosphate dehydrogenase [Sulfoacidibacillus thermotolerans]
MAVKIGISGMGRIGRLALRAAMRDPGVELVAVNSTTDPLTLAHLLRYDSAHGRLETQIQAEHDALWIHGKRIVVLNHRDPKQLPWGELGVDVVLEATGAFTTSKDASQHLTGGAKKVVISTAGKDKMLTIVYGVNHTLFDPTVHDVVSGASCTTNCLTPIVDVLHKEFGIREGAMTTIHSYTSDQRLLDNPHKDLRRARSAAQSLIPTATGAARAVAEVFPELKGRLNGYAVRVPTPDVSLVDFVVTLDKRATAEEINQALLYASQTRLKGVLDISFEPLISIDYLGNSHSSIVDGLSTMVIENNLYKIMAWYDNEWAYSLRMIDIMRYIGEQMDASHIRGGDLVADAST